MRGVMTPLGWFFIILMALATAISLSIAWKASPPVDLRGIAGRMRARLYRLARPLRTSPRLHHTGHHRAGAAPVLRVALPPAQVIAHADAMQRAAEQYLPELPPADDRYDWMAAQPQDGDVYRSLTPYAPAWEPVKIPETPDKPPWMITTNALEAVPDEPTDAQTHGLYFGGDWGTRPQMAVEAEAGAQPVMLP